MKIAYMKVSLFGLWVDTPFMIPHIFCCKQNKQDDTNKLSTFEEQLTPKMLDLRDVQVKSQRRTLQETLTRMLISLKWGRVTCFSKLHQKWACPTGGPCWDQVNMGVVA